MTSSYFIARFKKEIYSTLSLYRDIFLNPSLLLRGTTRVFLDIFYVLPRSIFFRHSSGNLEKHLEQSASQALTISEIITIPGNYVGFFLGKIFVDNVYIATIIGANLGDWISGVFSYAIFYMILTRGHGNLYTPKKALVDNLEVIKDCLPASIVLYISEAPIIAGLIFLGFSANIAIAINLAIAIILFIGVAKYSADKHIEERFE